jgi:hypothetical protein
MISTETTPEDHPEEPEIPAYGIEPAWIDCAGRTRTWALKDPHGTQVAVITTKGAALKLAALLSRVIERD